MTVSDRQELIAEAKAGLKSFAYGPGAGVVSRLLSALAHDDREKDRASILLEAAWEAVSQLGVTDSTAEDFLIPAILKADGDPDYAASTIAEMRAVVAAR